jgi:hypothetical protein
MSTKLTLTSIPENKNIYSQHSSWDTYNISNGTLAAYPRPQGKLPANLWLYKKESTPKDLDDFKKSEIAYQPYLGE